MNQARFAHSAALYTKGSGEQLVIVAGGRTQSVAANSYTATFEYYSLSSGIDQWFSGPFPLSDYGNLLDFNQLTNYNGKLIMLVTKDFQLELKSDISGWNSIGTFVAADSFQEGDFYQSCPTCGKTIYSTKYYNMQVMLF